LAAFRDKIMQRPGFPLIRLIVFGGVALGLVALASASDLTEQSTISSALLQPSAATHETRAGLQEVIEFPNANRLPRLLKLFRRRRRRAAASWRLGSVSGAKGYLLDVSTSNSFSSYVDGYHGLDVGNVNGRAVTGLNQGRPTIIGSSLHCRQFGRVLECHHGYDAAWHWPNSYSNIRLLDPQ
jgi:hypothetical protein